MLDSGESIAAAGLDRWSAAVAGCRFDGDDSDVDLLAIIASAERLKDACAALQARATHEYSERRLAALTVGSKPDRDTRRDIAARIARARRVSPTHGTRYLELARMLVRDLPRTLDALAAGHTCEYRASLVAHAAACLGTADRATLDADLGPRLTGKGNRAVQAEADRIASDLDAPAVVERHRRAAEDRRVTLRPAPDTMTYLTALLPVADGVAAWATLDRHATLAKSGGDRRTRGQIMADELRHRLLTGTASPLPTTGPTSPSVPGPSVVPTDCRVPAAQPVAPGSPPHPRRNDGDRGVDDIRNGAAQVTDPTAGGCPSAGDSPPETAHRSRGDRTTQAGAPPANEPSTHVPGHRPTADPAGPVCPAGAPAPGPPAVPAPPAAPPHDHDLDGVRNRDRDRAPVPVENAPPTGEVPAVPPIRQIDLMLVMTDRALLDDADTPAIITGHGPIPSALARGILAHADPATRVFLRRLYTDPTGDHLLTADARGRLFPHAIRQFVLARDHRCRTPYCDAPIRHIDHTVPHAAGGPTTLTNTSGLCERCSLTKAAKTDTTVQPGPPPPPPRSTPWNDTSDTAVGAP